MLLVHDIDFIVKFQSVFTHTTFKILILQLPDIQKYINKHVL